MTNIRVCELIRDGIDEELKFLEEEKTGLTPYTRFYNSVWTVVKQNVSLDDRALSESLEDAYIMLDVMNECLRRIEEMKHRVVVVIGGMEERRIATLTLTEGLITLRAHPRGHRVCADNTAASISRGSI